jgi:hypothetical protein
MDVLELYRRLLLMEFCVSPDCEMSEARNSRSAFRRVVSIMQGGRSERISRLGGSDVSIRSRSEFSALLNCGGRFGQRSWTQSLIRFALTMVLPFLCCSAYAVTGGSTCPSGTKYANVANEGQSGTFNVSLSSLGVTSCYYVGVNGLDSNSGTSEGAPFLHIPGTPKFTGSALLGPGIGVIIQGGYVAHFGATTSPATGGPLTINKGGSSGSPLYYGIDPTWYSGSSFSRPVFTGDNATSTSFPASCSYDNSSLGTFVTIGSSASYVILDGIESTGRCWSSGTPNVVQTTNSSHYIYMERWYVHGWTTPKTSTDSSYAWWDQSGNQDFDIVALNVVDGNDSSAGTLGSTNCQYAGYGTNSPCYSGGAIYEGAYTVWGNVFQHLSNVAVTLNTVKWHDNFVNNLVVTYQNGGQHTNCNNEITNVSGSNNYFYNNLTTNVRATECYYLSVSAGNTIYGFNNIYWGNMNYAIGSAPSGCTFLNLTSSSGSATLYWINNTMDSAGGNGGGCQLRFSEANSPLFAWNGTAYFENTQAIGYTSFSSLFTTDSSATLTANDNGGQLYQTESVANGQGYTSSNNYAPTSTSGASYHTGNNLSSICASIPDSFAATACTNGSSGGVSEIAGWGGEVANYSATAANPRGSSWDAGAYQYQVQVAPAPPQNLKGTAVPQ